MNPHKQLLRQPIRTLAMLFLLCVVSAFLCLGFGVLRSAEETLVAIEDQFVTVVFPRFTQHRKELNDGGVTFVEDYSAEEQSAILELAKTSSFSRGYFHQNYISAYSSSLVPVTSAEEDGHYDSNFDSPYNQAIFAITITELEHVEQTKRQGGNCYNVKATIDQAVLLHKSYTCQQTTRFIYYYEYPKVGQLQSPVIPLEVGGHYWICGPFYDTDLTARLQIAESVRCKPSEIDWNNITKNPLANDPETIAFYEAHPEYYWDPDELWYIEPTTGYSMTVGDYLELIGNCIINVNHLYAMGDTPSLEYETPEEAERAKQQEKLQQKALQEAIEKSYHCVPILGTDLLEGIYLFHENKAFLTHGRSFDWEDYKNGNPVCIISETLAASSGLHVGDVIDLSYYQGDGLSATGNDDATANPMARPVRAGETFIGESHSYEVVGIYRQESIWIDEVFENTSDGSFIQSSSYSFTPNTVFVPNASLEGLPTYTSDQGIYSTIVLENGSIEKLKAALTEAGLSPEALTYFDGGYSEIVETLDGFQESAKQLFYASVLTWVAAVVVYLILFVRHQRRSVGLMCSLGSGKGKAARFVWVISMLPVGAASVVGALVGMALMRGTLEKVFASVQDVLSTDFSSTVGGHISIKSTLVSLPWTAAIAALAQALVLAGVIWLCAHALASRKPLDNISAGGK